MRGRPWGAEDSATLEQWGGKVSDARIASMTGHAEITVRKRREAAGIRPVWTRRDWLLATAAGLDFQISDSVYVTMCCTNASAPRAKR